MTHEDARFQLGAHDLFAATRALGSCGCPLSDVAILPYPPEGETFFCSTIELLRVTTALPVFAEPY